MQRPRVYSIIARVLHHRNHSGYPQMSFGKICRLLLIQELKTIASSVTSEQLTFENQLLLSIISQKRAACKQAIFLAVRRLASFFEFSEVLVPSGLVLYHARERIWHAVLSHLTYYTMTFGPHQHEMEPEPYFTPSTADSVKHSRVHCMVQTAFWPSCGRLMAQIGHIIQYRILCVTVYSIQLSFSPAVSSALS